MGMHQEPRNKQNRQAETEAWRIIFATFAVSGSLVIGWTLFVLFTDTGQRPTRMGAYPGMAAESPYTVPTAKP
jgi:hypothetical protein